ncbi:MAG TPA: ABC transporter substrate-binding protein [bacterium]|nr:ABC transporter substrate-binding protein [bacterium]
MRVRWAVVLLIVASLVVPLSPVRAAGPSSSLVVVAGMWSPPNNFNPINTDSSYGFFGIRFIFDTLVAARLENNKLVFSPDLAQRWTVSPDRQTFTFTLNPKAMWHDGKPVTADDVVYTVMTISDPKTETNRGADIAQIAGLDVHGKRAPGVAIGIRAVNDRTVEVKTRVPVDPQMFLELFGYNVYILPKHVLADTPPDQLSKSQFFQHPTVGDGPFKFAQYRTDEYIELAANDAYHLGVPKVRRVFIRIIPPASMVAQLQRGDLDVTAGFGIGEVPIEDWDTVKTMPNVHAASFPAPGYQYMLFNFQKSYLQDKRVRQAMAEGINRQLMVSQLLRGEGMIADGPIPPANPYFNKAVKPWPYDVAKAKALLQEAGWDANRTLLLRVPVGNTIRERSADIIKENLAAVGIKTDIQKSDFPTLIAAAKRGDYDLMLIGWAGPTDPDVSSQYRTAGQYNFSFLSMPDMDKLLDAGAAASDPAKRKQIYDQFQVMFADQLPVLVLYYPNARTAISARMQNVLADPDGVYNFYSFRWGAGGVR